MPSIEFRPNKHNYTPIKKFKKPYLNFELYSIDHQLVQPSYLFNGDNWSRNHVTKQAVYKGRPVIGLPENSAFSSLSLTGTIPILETGDYLINIIGTRNPLASKTAQLTCNFGGTTLDPVDVHHNYAHPHVYDMGITHLTSGSKTVVITIPKMIYVWAIVVYKINKYVGKSGNTTSNKRLDVISVSDLTNNVTNELDTAKIEIAMNNDFLRPGESFSGYSFEFWDIANVYLGNHNDAKNLLGGYLIDVLPTENGLSLEIASRFADLLGEPVYQSFAVGINPKSDDTPQFPYKQFPSALMTCKYLAEVCDEVGIPLAGISAPHGYEKHFREDIDFNAVTKSGYHIQQIKRSGSNPALKVTLDLDQISINNCGVTNQEIELVLFNDASNPWNAAERNLHGIEYLAPSCATNASTMMQWNLGITMFKAGQSSANAVEYNIRWTGKSNVPRLIGSMPYTLNNKAHIAKFDLKKAFDKYVDSSAYYVTKVRLWNQLTTKEVTNHSKMVMYIDDPMSYSASVNAKMQLDQGTDKPGDLMKQILEEIGYVSYMSYGKYRKDDTLIFSPLENQPSDIDVQEGLNILEISNQEYNPMEYIANRVLCYYHYTEKDTEKTGKVFTENLDSYFHFRRPWSYFEDLSDVSTKTDAQIYADKHLSDNAYPSKSYSVKLEGTTLIKLSDYIVSKINNEPLSGRYGLKTLSYDMNFDEDGFITWLDVGRPSDYFYTVVDNMLNKIERVRKKDSRTVYQNRSLKTRGLTGVSSIIKSGTGYSNI